MAKHCESEFSNLKKNRIVNFLKFVILTGLILALAPGEESRADEPIHDPWYYVDRHTYKFSMPDKFQHFYGSAALAEVLGPMPALALGLTKEVYDDEYARVGFSVRDIIADVLGIMSASMTRTDNLSMWLHWNPGQQTLILQFGLRL